MNVIESLPTLTPESALNSPMISASALWFATSVTDPGVSIVTCSPTVVVTVALLSAYESASDMSIAPPVLESAEASASVVDTAMPTTSPPAVIVSPLEPTVAVTAGLDQALVLPVLLILMAPPEPE